MKGQDLIPSRQLPVILTVACLLAVLVAILILQVITLIFILIGSDTKRFGVYQPPSFCKFFPFI